jgi:hypothetical protein
MEATTPAPRWSKISAMTHAERQHARREKERKVLAFLRQEIWATPRVLAVLLQNPQGKPADKATVSRLVSYLKAQGLVETETLDEQHFVVGITADGQARAAQILGKDLVVKEYQRGRVSLSTFAHREDLQLLHIRCVKAGWGLFTYPDRLPVSLKAKAPHRPDAITRPPNGQQVAVEIERTIKTQKRYAAIIGGHLANMQAGLYQHVIYASPDRARAQAVAKIFSEIGRVVVQGRDVALDAASRGKFSFLTYEEVTKWPQC